ncbi:hypothetical protein [Sandarakinorhabdus sp.]|uniref:hypothetical protein n=1 Tax=Sandarakinorhabdus sp. TaxID=1916663 RepID=UPI0033411F30
MKQPAFILFALLAAAPAAADNAPPPPETRICLNIASIRQTLVRSDSAIDFVLRDGSIWRNILPFRCAQLGAQRAFSYQTSISQLCRQDLIKVVLQSGGQMTTASCGFGPFERQPTASAAPPAKHR